MSRFRRPLYLLPAFLLAGLSYVSAQIPTISSITPAAGPPGTILTVNGTNFSPVPSENILFIGTMRAGVIAATPTQLTAQVPPGCPYGPLGLTVNGRTTTSTQYFMTSYRATDTADGRHFLPGAVMPTLNGAAMVTTADLDGDGRLDLLNSSQGDGSVAIFRNAGTGVGLEQGVLEPMISFHTGHAVISVGAGDVDGDGRLDVLSSNFTPYTLTVLRNVSSPGSLSTSSFTVTADLTTGWDPMNSAAHDFDGDGRVDLAVQNLSSHDVSLFRNTSTGPGSSASAFSPRANLPTGIYPGGMTAGDLDGDGKVDLVVTAATVHVHRNVAVPGTLNDQSFTPSVQFTVGEAPSYPVLGDIDSDGKLDIVVRCRDSSIAILRNTSVPGSITGSSFAPAVRLGTLGYAYSLALADFNGDGRLDIAVPAQSRRALTILYNRHKGGELLPSSFTAPIVVVQEVYTDRIAAGDLDGDGRPDLIALDASIRLFRNSPPPVTFPPPLLAPRDSAVGVPIPSPLRWGSVRFAEQYQVQCALDTSFGAGAILDTLLADTTAFAAGVSFDTVYSWRVRGWNSTGYGPWSLPSTFRTLPARPGAPVLESPADRSTGQSLSPRLTWGSADYTLSYHVRVWNREDTAKTPVWEDTSVVDTEATANLPARGTWYSWSVRARGGGGYGPWSPVWTFRTAANMPDPILLLSPPSGTVIVGDTVRLVWHRGRPEIAFYWLDVGTDSLFAYTLTDSTVVDTVRVVRSLQRGFRYWWRVRGRNDGGLGPFSETRQFSVSLSGAAATAEIPEAYVLHQNFPNPFNPATTIRYGLPCRSLVTLSVFNALGQHVAQLVAGIEEAGYHEARFDATTLSSGVYFYRLVSRPAEGTRFGEFTGRGKLLLVK